ncbi:response regulator transcription factor [Pleurocapsa sp. PCC 7319]|uniref:response regulator n=1 Tax=Pleurocapsa sp. PCC 7319 TaxID=118161 RepID=UPI000349953A|nr:response regulator transcription factor [Pleurocapsa sp. PCC 7319]
MTSTSPIRVLLADDHPVLVDGLALILDTEPDMTVVGRASSGTEAVTLFAQHQPDVALLDLRMPGELSGADAIAQIRTQFPEACIIMFTIYDGDEDIYQGLKAGAKAYLLKSTPCDEIIATIRRVYAGKKHIPPQVAVKIAERMNQTPLTKREREVLCLMTEGKNNQEISTALNVTEGTVKFHINKIFDKLAVRNRTEAVLVALKRGIACL